VHVGIRQEVVWRHVAQYKHHRWRLDGGQVMQYQLGGALSPSMDWWEAVSVPRRSLQIIDEGAVTVASLVCEDLARLEPVADLMRAIGPSLVVTLLLDGPQLGSRWTARYASVLADDPGSAVLALSSYGMVQRCRPPGCAESHVVALWKDVSGGLTEIELEPGSEAVLISTEVVAGDVVTADGRWHRASAATLRLAGVQPVRADREGPRLDGVLPSTGLVARGTRLPPLQEKEVSKATSWAEAVAEAVVGNPDQIDPLLDQALNREWRDSLDLPAPSQLFEDTLTALRRELPRPATAEGLKAAADRLYHDDAPTSIITGMLLGIALEQRLLTEVRSGRLAADALEQEDDTGPVSDPPAHQTNDDDS
jgi:hypothetical protein